MATAVEWRTELETTLNGRKPEIARLRRYYSGDVPLPVGPPKTAESYRQLLNKSRSNWGELVVDATAERLRVEGIRLGGSTAILADARTATATEDPALEVWRQVWQPEKLDSESDLVTIETLVTGRCFVLVWPRADGTVSITGEPADQMVCAYEPGRRWGPVAAMKQFKIDTAGTDLPTGLTSTTLWLPGEVHQWGPTYDEVTGRVVKREEHTVTDHNLGVPVVEFRSRPQFGDVVQSELGGGVTDIIDRINETVFLRMLASQFGAHRQRWASGPIDLEDENGAIQAPWDAAVDRLWVAPTDGGEESVRFGEFSQTDLGPYINSVEADIQHLAAITRTPPHYLLGQSGSFPSGESLTATDTGAAAKARRHQVHLGESWEEVLRLALGMKGMEGAEDQSAAIIWADPQSRNEGTLVDALVKMRQIGTPLDLIWERWGMTPAEIAVARRSAQREQLLALSDDGT